MARIRAIAVIAWGLVGLASFQAPRAAAQPIRVLVSIAKEKTSHQFASKIETQLQKRGFHSTDYRLTENADQLALYEALNHPETQAVIWLSHGATARLTRKMKRELHSVGGMSAQPELIDYRGDNVAPVFKKYSPGLRYVAVIGCNSKEILSYVGSDLADEEGISKFIPEKNIIAQFAIRKAVKQLANIGLNRNTVALPIQIGETFVRITRSAPANAQPEKLRSLRVMIGKELIGMVPPPAPGETNTWALPVSDDRIHQVKLESGQHIMTSPDDVDFGEIRVELPNQVEMKPFAKADGTPFGLNFRLYLLP